jgi:hypothetical protein
MTVASADARAQEPAPQPPATRADTVRRDTLPPFREYGGVFMPRPGRTGALAGFRVYGPMRKSVWLGAIRASRDPALLGWTGEVEAGQGGVQVAAGRGGTGVARLHATVLHTWGNPMWVRPNQTYVGGEVRLGIFMFGFGLVGYRRIQGSAPGDAWMGGITGVFGV